MFRLGDPVRVVVIRAVKEDLRIDFGLVEHLPEATYVGGEGPGAIVYDEDLTPKERRETVRRRREAASRSRGQRKDRDGRGEGRARRDRESMARAGVRLSDWDDGEEEDGLRLRATSCRTSPRTRFGMKSIQIRVCAEGARRIGGAGL